MHRNYQPATIEKKWQKIWEETGVYRQYARKKKFYVLDMFPYPSGAGLHVGHPRGYIATDIVARLKQLQGYGALHPMGWDAFGLPAEQYALKNQLHPSVAVKKNIVTFKKQLAKIGFTYDWEREINTTDPEYYKWTQWAFLQMYHKGLVYASEEPINWCPSCKTGLANEDLEQGKCERCGSVVEKKPMRQWVLAMTRYAERLLKDLESPALEWSESIKDQQRNWIGRSEGVEIIFPLAGTESELRVFTTRVDTIFGCTYVVVAPEHPLIAELTDRIANFSEVTAYIKQAASKSDLERTELAKEKTGVKLRGIEAVNPLNGERVPVYVADYVLGNYGTGAVMAVPAHDERDSAFAAQYGLPVKRSIAPLVALEGVCVSQKDESLYTGEGVLTDSGDFSGLTSAEARKKMTAWLVKEKMGQPKVNYKMRDWTFSRQRYWGEPIPLVHCEACGVVPVPEKELPVLLPNVKSYAPTGTGESPLAGVAKWVNTTCPQCQGKAKRETNTMPQWAGSCWYYLRFIDPKNPKALVDKKKEAKMMPVDLYVGGTEHATRHLLYARFWHKFLFDIGVVSSEEPFQKLVNQGLITASDGRKMSKRWGNVVNPDEVIADFGADAFRVYEMFMGPFGQAISWNTDGVVGTRRFLEKVWKLSAKVTKKGVTSSHGNTESLLHQTIKKVTADIEDFKFNTAVSSLMVLVNAFEKEPHISLPHYRMLLILLAPFAPHIAEELWSRLGQSTSIFLAEWPLCDESKIAAESLSIAVQVNGKVRAVLVVAPGTTEKALTELALADPNVRTHLAERVPQKMIYIPGKILSIVV